MDLAEARKKLEEALAEQYGWSAHPVLRERVSFAVSCKAQRLGIEPEEYCQLAAGSSSELLSLVEEAAAGASSFFRQPHQFSYLRETVLPELMSTHPPNDRLRFWSAACSTGEEPYSLAIIFDLARHEDSQQQVDVIATDLRNRALLRASQARYPAVSLTDVDQEIRGRYFERISSEIPGEDGEWFLVVPDVRRVVAFRRVNLLEKIVWKGMAGKFDLILCANQLLYLHPSAARQMINNLTNSLCVGGFLMVAPEEIPLVAGSRLAQQPACPSCFQRLS